MTVKEFLASIVKLVEENPAAADMPMLYRHGASGDCGPIGSAHITNSVDDCGPFLSYMGMGNDGDNYVSVYVGN